MCLETVKQLRKLEVHNALYKWAREYGKVYKFWFGRNSIVVISGRQVTDRVQDLRAAVDLTVRSQASILHICTEACLKTASIC